MRLGGGAVGRILTAVSVPYGEWLGVALGGVLVFVGFSVPYRRSAATFDTE